MSSTTSTTTTTSQNTFKTLSSQDEHQKCYTVSQPQSIFKLNSTQYSSNNNTLNFLHSSPSTILSTNSVPNIHKKVRTHQLPPQSQSKVKKQSKSKKSTIVCSNRTYLEGFETVSFTANQSMFGVTRKRKCKLIEYEQVWNFGCVAPPSSENSVIPKKMRKSPATSSTAQKL